MKKVFIVSYFLFLILVTVYSYLFIDPGLFYLKFLFTNFFQTNRLATTLLFVIMLFLFFGFYAWVLYAVKQKTLIRKDIIWLIAGSCVILLFAYPAMLSFDIFNYIATAKVTFFYHENPYLIMPIAFLKDPLLLFMHAANKTALYAPFWILLTGIPFFLGFGNFLLTLFAFKLLATLFYLATVFLLWRMTKDIGKTAFFALNPLVLIETLISAHNDMSMMFFMLLGCFFLFTNRKGKSFFILTLSFLIKYATILLAPLFARYMYKPLTKEKFFFYATLIMYGIFFLSSLREEIYPWYSIWFLLPVSFLAGDTFLTWISVTFSCSMLLRYIPFMFLGTYFGPTPLIKTTLTFLPVVLTTSIYLLRKQTKQ